MKHFQTEQMGYMQVQGTRPQTISYAHTDSPAGQLAWIIEKFKEWTDPASELPEDAVDRDTLLTNASVYWFTASAGSSANLYYETFHDPALGHPKPRGTVPTGVLVSLPSDVAICRLAERDHNMVHWTESERGGHFFALEQPALFVDDVRTFFHTLS
jgi:epoxide hydrolase